MPAPLNFAATNPTSKPVQQSSKVSAAEPPAAKKKTKGKPSKNKPSDKPKPTIVPKTSVKGDVSQYY